MRGFFRARSPSHPFERSYTLNAWKAFWIMFAISAVVGFAQAATPGDRPSDARCGAVNVQTTPTAIPCPTPNGSNGCVVQNLGANPLYCNFSNPVDGGTYLLDGGVSTSVNWGIQVAASGGSFTFDLWQPPRTASGALALPILYCQTSSNQSAGTTNTRYCGVK